MYPFLQARLPARSNGLARLGTLKRYGFVRPDRRRETHKRNTNAAKMIGKTARTVRSGGGARRTKEYDTLAQLGFGLLHSSMYRSEPGTAHESSSRTATLL